jgi:hypothetical protein
MAMISVGSRSLILSMALASISMAVVGLVASDAIVVVILAAGGSLPGRYDSRIKNTPQMFANLLASFFSKAMLAAAADEEKRARLSSRLTGTKRTRAKVALSGDLSRLLGVGHSRSASKTTAQSPYKRQETIGRRAVLFFYRNNRNKRQCLFFPSFPQGFCLLFYVTNNKCDHHLPSPSAAAAVVRHS